MIIFDAAGGTVVHRLDPRFRVVVVSAFALLVVLSARPLVLGAALALALATLAAARPSVKRSVHRLVELNLFMLLFVAFLPLFVPGARAFGVGGLAWSKEGLWQAGLIAGRANAIMIALTALLTTMEPAHLGFALDGIGCPRKLSGILLFMVRYIEVFHVEYHRLRNAMRLRGFRARCDRHTFRTFGYLIGLLVVRSLDRSERVLKAMKCRGFRGHFYLVAPFKVGGTDVGFAIVAAGCIAAMAWLEWR